MREGGKKYRECKSEFQYYSERQQLLFGEHTY